MTDTFVILCLAIGAFIVMLVNFWLRKGPLAIVTMLSWFIVSVYCIYMVRNSGDSDFGTWTWAFAFVSLLCSIISGLTPKIFANPSVQGTGPDEFDKAVGYGEQTDGEVYYSINQKKEWDRLKRLGIKKKKHNDFD